jgi:hypothetical protein
MTYQIVVSRYKENIDWVEELKDLDFKVTIYNKYEGSNLLPNVGRESHTYIHHIVENWDNLADVTIFVQGNPFDHCHTFLNILNDIRDNNIDFYMLTNYLDGNPQLIFCDKNSQPHGVKFGKFIPSGLLYEWLTLTKSPETFIASPGAQFAVNKKVIMNRTKKFYERALKSLNYSSDPIEGHCFERIWPTIFGARSKYDTSVIDYSRGEEQFKELSISSKEYQEITRTSTGIKLLGDLNDAYQND